MSNNVPFPGSVSRVAAVVLACLAVGTFTGPVRAWNARGHKLVAFIAFQHLNATAKAKVSALLTLNPQFDDWKNTIPANASDERKTITPFLEAAKWPDFIRNAPTYISDGENHGNFPPDTPEASQNIGYEDHFRHKYWHFINVPFTDDGTATLNPPGVNAQTQIEILREALGKGVNLKRRKVL
jgi:S1/P1 Nuclease